MLKISRDKLFLQRSKPLPTSKRTGWKRRSLALGRLAGSVTKHCLMKSFCCSSSRDSMHFWMVSAVTWSNFFYRKPSDENKSKKRGCWLPGHPSRRCLSTQVQSFQEHTYLGNKQWFQHFYNIRHLGVFFCKFGLDGNLTKCKYVDGTSEGHAWSLWEKKNVIKQYQEDNIFLILLTYYIMC